MALNKRRKATLLQAKRIISRFEKIGLILEHNVSVEDASLYYIRISITETGTITYMLKYTIIITFLYTGLLRFLLCFPLRYFIIVEHVEAFR